MGPRCLLCGAGVQVYTSTWSGVGGGRRGLQQSTLARAMCWQDENCRGRAFGRERDENQMDASSSFAVVAVLALVLSARWCRKPTALDLTALACCYATRYQRSQTASAKRSLSFSLLAFLLLCPDRLHLLSAYDKASPIERATN